MRLDVRITKVGNEAILSRAIAAQVKRSEMVRRMLIYAEQNMPRA